MSLPAGCPSAVKERLCDMMSFYHSCTQTLINKEKKERRWRRSECEAGSHGEKKEVVGYHRNGKNNSRMGEIKGARDEVNVVRRGEGGLRMWRAGRVGGFGSTDASVNTFTVMLPYSIHLTGLMTCW